MFSSVRNNDVDSEIVLVLRPVVVSSAEDKPHVDSLLTSRMDDVLERPLLLP